MYWLCNQICNNEFRTIWYFQQICKGYIQSNSIIKLVFVFKAKANPLKSLAKPTKDLWNRNECENYINLWRSQLRISTIEINVKITYIFAWFKHFFIHIYLHDLNIFLYIFTLQYFYLYKFTIWYKHRYISGTITCLLKCKKNM